MRSFRRSHLFFQRPYVKIYFWSWCPLNSLLYLFSRNQDTTNFTRNKKWRCNPARLSKYSQRTSQQTGWNRCVQETKKKLLDWYEGIRNALSSPVICANCFAWERDTHIENWSNAHWLFLDQSYNEERRFEQLLASEMLFLQFHLRFVLIDQCLNLIFSSNFNENESVEQI